MRKRKSNQSDTFAKRLKSLMITRQLTQQKVADAAGVSRTAVIKWLRGAIPGSGELYRLSKALQKPMEWFLEVIPYDKPTKAELDKMPIASVRASAIPPEMREHIATSFDVGTNPELLKAFFNAFGRFCESHRKTQLTKKAYSLTSNDVQPVLPKLIERLKLVTSERGQKSKLAAWLGVHRQCVTDWLSGKQEPGGEITLKMLRWVEQQERQK